MVPVFVGSNPITHPRKRRGDLWSPLLFLFGAVMGFEEGDPSEGWVKIESWRAIFSPGENPLHRGAQSVRTVKCGLSFEVFSLANKSIICFANVGKFNFTFCNSRKFHNDQRSLFHIQRKLNISLFTSLLACLLARGRIHRPQSAPGMGVARGNLSE